MKKRTLIFIILSVIIVTSGIITGILLYRFAGANNFLIKNYDSNLAQIGTTLFADTHDPDNPRIIEVDMEGAIVWEYLLPEDLKKNINPGPDVERLPNNNVLFICPEKGVYEINRNGVLVWSYLNTKISHDCDRLPNGNTLICWGGNDTKSDAQVIEVAPNGTIVWKWQAKNQFDVPPYDTISAQGWTHANSVTRLPNGNTMVNLRNFNLTVEVNQTGHVVWQFDWGLLGDDPHEPELLSNGNILIALQGDFEYQAAEITYTTKQLVWTYGRENMIFTRDADRLPNGNTLFVAIVDQKSTIFEVTSSGEIVWELVWGKNKSPIPGWFYKAERII
jgi:hypothetical protein